MSKRAYTAAVVNSFDPERENSTGEKVRYLERLGFLRVLHVVNRASCRRREVTVLLEIAVSTARCSVKRRRPPVELVSLIFLKLGEWFLSRIYIR